MTATARLIRRTLRAALTASRHVVRAAVSAHYRLLVRLCAAIDTGTVVRITYRDADGQATMRDIQPRDLTITQAGHIILTAHDLLRDDRRTFRTDRMTIAA